MLWAKLDQDGNLTIQADEPIEAYALQQWERQRAAGKAKLTIETGRLFTMEQLCAAMMKDAKSIAQWKRERGSAVLGTAADVADVNSLSA